jgi:hypothetical protein
LYTRPAIEPDGQKDEQEIQNQKSKEESTDVADRLLQHRREHQKWISAHNFSTSAA